MLWRLFSFLVALFGYKADLGDEMDNAPEPDGNDSVHKEAVDGLSS